MNFSNDDFFSPVRPITSDSDSSIDFENSSNIPSSEMTVTFAKVSQKKHVSEHNKTKCGKEANELGSCSSESNFALKPEDTNICTPVLKRNSAKPKKDSKANLLNFDKVKLESGKYSKDNIKKERSSKGSESHAKKQDCQENETMADCDATKLNIKQNNGKKGVSRPTSLSLSKKESSKRGATKELKKDKNVIKSADNICNLDIQASNTKHSEKNLINNSLEASSKNVVVPGGKSTDLNSNKSHNCNSSNSKSDASSKNSRLDQSVENSKSRSNIPANSPFEISVENIVHDLISSECDTIRQNLYAQRMSIYREFNKIKDELEAGYAAHTERMLTIIKQLEQMK